MPESNKLLIWFFVGILILFVYFDKQIEKIEEKIDFVWKDIGADLDAIKEKLDAMESEVEKIDAIESTIQDMHKRR